MADTLNAQCDSVPEGSDPFAKARDLISRKEWDAATTECGKLLQNAQMAADALCLLGVISYRLGDLSGAIGLFERAVDAPGASSDVPEVLAVLYALVGRIHEALYYAKRATVFPLDERILGLLRPNFPIFGVVFANIQERPLYFEGVHQLENGDYQRAITSLQQNLALEVRHEPTMAALGRALLFSGRSSAAANVLRSLRAVAPDNPQYISLLAQALAASGDHAAGRACHLQAIAMAPEDVSLRAAFLRDSASDLDCPAAVAAEQWRCLHDLLKPDCDADDWERADAGVSLSIGILCQPNPAAFVSMVSEVLHLRDRKHIRIRGYGFGSLSLPRNQPYRIAVDAWTDIGSLDQYTAAEIVKNDEIDILIDLCGLEQPQVLEILAQRPVPTQVAWLETAPAQPLPNIDYLLSGPVKGGEGERIWALPHIPWALEPKAAPVNRPIAGSQGGITLGADIGMRDLVPELVMAWSEILRRVPHATLVLRQGAFSVPEDTVRLVDLFGNFGISHRVDLVDAADAASLAADCDIALLPFTSTSPQFALQALAVGTPVLLRKGGKQGDIIGQTLAQLGVADRLSAETPEDYIERAVTLAANPGQIAELSQEIIAKAVENALPAPAMVSSDLRDAFVAMVAAQCRQG